MRKLLLQVKRLYPYGWGRFLQNNYFALTIVSVLMIVSMAAGSTVQAATERPEQKIWNAVSKLSQVRSLVYDGAVSYYGQVSTRYSDLLSGMMVKKNPAQYQTFTVNFKGGKEIFTRNESQSWFSLSTKSSDKKEIALGLETRYVGHNFYASLNKADNVPSDLQAYKNIWVQFSTNSLLQELGIDRSLLDKKELVRQTDKADEEKLKTLLVKSKAFVISRIYTAKSGGELFSVYNFTINKNNLKKLATQAASLPEPLLTTSEARDLTRRLDKAKSISGSVWIGRKDSLPYRFNLTILGTKPKEKTTIALNFKNFNQSIEVFEPVSYITWQELFEKIFSEPFDRTTTSPSTTAALW